MVNFLGFPVSGLCPYRFRKARSVAEASGFRDYLSTTRVGGFRKALELVQGLEVF